MSLLQVENLGKAYRNYRSEWHRVGRWVGLPFQPRDEHWVLRHVTFDLRQGEAVGIVGQNGAGKSTLLKLITGTLKPTEGSVQTEGSTSAVLELGMGFNAELTGRQNARHATGLMGFTQAQINAAIYRIEEFAEIGEYFDEPVRTYSSGMRARVAFAVASAHRPDLLLVDEVLSVGDAAFRRKCFQRLEEFREAGTTLLLVSHDSESVKRLCRRAIFLDRGRMVLIGDAKSVCDAYEERLFGRKSSGQEKESQNKTSGQFDPTLMPRSIERQYGDNGATISEVELRSQSDERLNIIPEGERFSVVYNVRFNRPVEGVRFGMMIKNAEGACIFATNTDTWDLRDCFDPGDEVQVRFALEGNLIAGTYYLNVGSTHRTKEGPVFLHRRTDCQIFRIVSSGAHWAGGYANLFARPSQSSRNLISSESRTTEP